jgi:hypothetical protein
MSETAPVDYFVDRDKEQKTFCEWLDDGKRSVIGVWGLSGMGKSLLIDQMIHLCANRKVRKAKIVFRDDFLPEYLSILRTCREDVGVEPFIPFTKKTREFFADPTQTNIFNISGDITVGKQAVVKGEVGQMAGVQVIVDPMTSEPRIDIGVSEDERRIRLTVIFLDCLKTAAVEGMIVIFVDAVEKMPDNTAVWLWNDLIDGAAQRNCNVRFVISGQQKPRPPQNSQAKERHVNSWMELKPLTENDVSKFLEKRGCPADKLDEVTNSAMAASDAMGVEGSPLYIAMFADARERRGW